MIKQPERRTINAQNKTKTKETNNKTTNDKSQITNTSTTTKKHKKLLQAIKPEVII